jgi:hypothetical protein
MDYHQQIAATFCNRMLSLTNFRVQYFALIRSANYRYLTTNAVQTIRIHNQSLCEK